MDISVWPPDAGPAFFCCWSTPGFVLGLLSISKEGSVKTSQTTGYNKIKSRWKLRFSHFQARLSLQGSVCTDAPPPLGRNRRRNHRRLSPIVSEVRGTTVHRLSRTLVRHLSRSISKRGAFFITRWGICHCWISQFPLLIIIANKSERSNAKFVKDQWNVPHDSFMHASSFYGRLIW